MRSILTTAIACLLLPSASVVAHSPVPRRKTKVPAYSIASTGVSPATATCGQVHADKSFVCRAAGDRWSTELPQKQEEVETSNQQQKPRPPKQVRESDSKSGTLDFSGTGRPGQQTAGESRGSCVNAPKPIKAMLPQSNSGSTVKAHPSFWVYFPELDNKTTELEFIIQDESRKDIWRSRSPSESSTGYQSFSLPKTEDPLKVGQWYRWYVKVYCDEQVVSTQYVQGWVNRVPLNSRLYLELQQNPVESHLTYGTNRIWYDAIDRLLNSYHRHPQSINLEKDWQNLIGAKGVQLRELPSIGGSQISIQ